MQDPVATVDGQVYDRPQIQKWIQLRRQRKLEITSPSTNLPLPSPTLVPVISLQKAIKTYLLHRPEVRKMLVASRSVEEAAELLQNELLEKQAVHQSAQEELNRLRATVKHLEACKAENQVLRHLVEEQKLQLEDMAVFLQAMEARSASSRKDVMTQAQTLPNQEPLPTDHGRQAVTEEAILPLEEADRRNSDADNWSMRAKKKKWLTQQRTPTQALHHVTPGPSQTFSNNSVTTVFGYVLPIMEPKIPVEQFRTRVQRIKENWPSSLDAICLLAGIASDQAKENKTEPMHHWLLGVVFYRDCHPDAEVRKDYFLDQCKKRRGGLRRSRAPRWRSLPESHRPAERLIPRS
ncbi:unnamed protein product [Polarella glacialis]|uniref:U-box domain-containing protein n=1 Tax=Polarella glacialis TaxID=89957 RepID=A0A813LXU3_POLGL|nr:unnamed protein product [Polarella glacialis]